MFTRRGQMLLGQIEAEDALRAAINSKSLDARGRCGIIEPPTFWMCFDVEPTEAVCQKNNETLR